MRLFAVREERRGGVRESGWEVGERKLKMELV